MFLLNDNNTYDRFIENHVQRAHSIDEIKQLLKKDFEILDILSESDLKEIKDDDVRIYFIAKRRKRNNGK
jgi:predicted nucleic acid-binding OB-fold protein